MKQNVFFLAATAGMMLVSSDARSQGGVVTTVAGCYSCISTSADGTPAKSAFFDHAAGMGIDASNNVYIAEYGSHKVRRVLSPSTRVYTYAGTGTAGFSGDGGAATAAMLNKPNGIFIDGANNLYIADEGNNRIRKVDATTGIITTVAGGGASTVDGIPATNAAIQPQCVYVDAAGNIYTGGGNKLKKIDAVTGLISTVAGDGTTSDAGDGGLALSAGISGPIRDITKDASGNFYIVPGNGDRVRKIDGVTGIISTVAGGGICTVDGVQATASFLKDLHSCVVDASGNLIVADRGHGFIRIADATTQNMYTLAGGGVSTAEGALGSSAYVNDYRLYLDNSGSNIYFTDSAHWIRKLTYSPLVFLGLPADSFSVTINRLCSGPQILVTTTSYYTGLNLTTWFGDGQMVNIPITMGCLSGSSAGTATMNHTYANSGTYTIKQVLYIGTTPIDSLQQLYKHTLCNSIHVNLYYDVDNNCVKDNTDHFINSPIVMEVDSNGIAVDTISATSGFYYTAHGNVGDIYQFKPYLLPHGLNVVCPATKVLSDTLQSVLYNTKESYLAFSCSSTVAFDLFVKPVISATGIRDQGGHIYMGNNSCFDNIAKVTLTHSPKYNHSAHSYPLGSVSGNTITWNLSDVKSINPLPYLWYAVAAYPILKAGDTVHTFVSITPITGDINPANNTIEIIDTVKASCDPNYVAVRPGGCIPVGITQLEYTIHFENTGNDTAFNIYVMDTLSDDVDPGSMRLIMASHQMDVSVVKGGGHNILKFDFPNINLLDSSHHGECDGAVIFTINLKSDIPTGTLVHNNAGIYFDYNEVVNTNTTENIIGCPLGVNSIVNAETVEIFPNPATEELTIKMDKQSFSSYSISNSLGQELLKHEMTAAQTTVNLKTLPAGLYYVTLKGDYGTKVQKFVKL